MTNQVSRGEELLNTARDCLRFVTTYFEPINVSAVHIYHSALELSPLSSIVRQLYYHQRPTPFPHVVTGTPGLWNQCTNIASTPTGSCYEVFTWSPCGQLIAARCKGGVEIRDLHSSELLSTLQPTKPTSHVVDALAYSPDGHSLATFSNGSLIIWDIQTGGAARVVEYGPTYSAMLVWSLDGWAISIILRVFGLDPTYTVCIFNLNSGATQYPGKLQSIGVPHLWAHGNSFWIMTKGWDGQAHTITTFEVGSVLTEIRSFHIGLFGQYDQIETFSPPTYRISVSAQDQLHISDIQTSECLLKEEGNHFRSHCFSSDGSLFAASLPLSICIWKYGPNHYSPWREFPNQIFNTSLQFSPTLSSIAGYFSGTLQVWNLDLPPTVVHPGSHTPLAALSHQGAYIATAHRKGHTVTITNLLSQATPQLINTGMVIEIFALTGNVLLVFSVGEMAAWQLTDEGVVDGIFGDEGADHHNKIWAVPLSGYPGFFIKDQIVVVIWKSQVICTYHMGTGKLLELASLFSNIKVTGYSPWDMLNGQHYPHSQYLPQCIIDSNGDWPVSEAALQNGWVKDTEGQHRLWIPIEWRVSPLSVSWLSNIEVLRLAFYDKTIIVKL